MSSFIRLHKLSFTTFLAASFFLTASLVTCSLWAAPPASRPFLRPAPRTGRNLSTTQTESAYAARLRKQNQQQRVKPLSKQTTRRVKTTRNGLPTNRPLRRQTANQTPSNRIRPFRKQSRFASSNRSGSPELKKVTTEPNLARVPQTRRQSRSLVQPRHQSNSKTRSGSLFGVIKDKIHPVAGTVQPRQAPQSSSNIQSELQKLYAADGRAMPQLPQHHPQPAPVAEQQQQAASSANGQRPNLSRAKQSRFSFFPRKPPRSRSQHKLSHKNRPAPSNSSWNRSYPPQPGTQTAANASGASPQKPNAFKRFIGRLGIGRKRQANPTGEPAPQLASPGSNGRRLNHQPGTSFPNQATRLATKAGQNQVRPQQKPQPKPQVAQTPAIKKHSVAKTVEEPVPSPPEEILVQKPGRIELDLNNAFGEMEEDFEEETMDLVQDTGSTADATEEDTTPVNNSSAFANSNNEPVRLKLDAAPGTATVELETAPAETVSDVPATQTADLDSPFLMEEEPLEELSSRQGNRASENEIDQAIKEAMREVERRETIRMTPREPATLNEKVFTSSAAPIKNARAATNDDIQDVTHPEMVTGILGVSNTLEAPGMGRFCPHTLRNELKLVEGLPQFRAVYNSRVYWFASHEAKTMFQANPELYTPSNGGNDPVLQESFDYKTEGSALHSLWYRGRLYLFASNKTKETFRLNPLKYASQDFLE